MPDPSDTSRSTLSGIDRSKLDAIIEPIAVAHGAEIVDVEWKSEPGGWVLRLIVEKLGSAEQRLSTEAAAINLELCSNIARDVSPALDVADLVPHAYHLEVSSPGVERKLRGERDFERFQGQKAKLKLHEGVATHRSATNVRQKVVVGSLGPLQAGHLTITDGPTTHTIPLSDIASARLVFEFGPAPKPGKSGKNPGATTRKSAASSTKRSV